MRENSIVLALVTRYVDTIRPWVDGSVSIDLMCRETVWLETLLEQILEHSVVYQWLTTDPEPGEVVIELSETKTVGPVLRVCKRLYTTLLPVSAASKSVQVSLAAFERVCANPVRHFLGILLLLVLIAVLWSFAIA